MSRIYTFHKTVIGNLHIKNGIICEDYSASFSAENNRYHIAIVADGHGSRSCFRSAFGAKKVTEVAFDCLQELAETVLASEDEENRFYKEKFLNHRDRKTTLRQLTDTIIARWHNCVLEDYESTPPSLEEMGEFAAEYQNGENVSHIYGTTVIAALWLPMYLILLQQGDGRCDVFYENSTVNQPIPWDSRCEDTVTTSMCDDDVMDSFRTHVVDLSAEPVIACYLGTDGVEDAYRDTYEALGGCHVLMGGVHTFYKDLTCEIAARDAKDFEAYLDIMLPEFSALGRFSRCGSGDDVSVAGIVDIEAVSKIAENFRLDVRQYDLEESLFWKEDELRGKTRKYGILQKRMKDAEEDLENCKNRNEKIHELEEIYADASKAFQEYDVKYKSIEAEKKRIEDEIEVLLKSAGAQNK